MSFIDIAIVPARGGSKGVIEKNLQEINGKSLTQITIEAAQKAKVFDEIVVSSDCNKVLSLAKNLEVAGHRRSKEASSDISTAEDVILDFIKNINIIDRYRITYLQPTSPMRNSRHIEEALDIANTHETNSCVSVKKVKDIPEKMVEIVGNKIKATNFDNINLTANRQMLIQRYIPNGAIYIFPLRRFIETKKFPIVGAAPYIMDTSASVDIDSMEDLILARQIWAINYGNN